jgi:hypothetical protein
MVSSPAVFSLLALFSAAINPGEVKEPKNISEKELALSAS